MMRVQKTTNVYNPTNLPVRLDFVYYDYREEVKGKRELKCRVYEIKSNCALTELKDDPQYDLEDLKNWFCIDFKKIQQQCAVITKEPNYRPYIGGYLGDTKWGYVQMIASNSEHDNDFKVIYQGTLSEVKELDSFFIDLRYPKFYLKKNQFENALSTRFEIERHNLYPYSRRFDSRFMKQVSLHDDIGWVQEQIETKRSIELDKILSQPFTNSLDKEGLIGFYNTIFYLGRNEKEFNRRFMKLSDIFAQVAGIMKPIMIAIVFFMTFYNSFERDSYLIRNLFDRIDYSLSKNDTKIDVLVVAAKVEDSKIEEVKKKEVTLGFFNYYFCTFRQSVDEVVNMAFFKNARQYISKKIDVQELFKFYEKFEKLIEITLNEEQLLELNQERRTKIT